MDIGTAKPTIHEREEVPHHCIDVRDPDEYFSAGEYGKLARIKIHDILNQGKLPIVVGGSGLYIKALVDGLFFGDYRDAEVRMQLKRKAEEKGLEVLYHRLCELDPIASKRIHPNDFKRIIRALEVYELSGKAISSIQKEMTVPSDFIPQFWGLRWKRETLYQRIHSRVDEMIASGLVQEVEQLKAKSYNTEYSSLDSVGYGEVFEYLNGLITYQEMIHLIKQNTRRMAKKQLTWFNRDPRIKWIDLEEPVHWMSIAKGIIDTYYSVL